MSTTKRDELAITGQSPLAAGGQILLAADTSKAALTMLTLQYAQALPDILVNAAWPGYTATDLNDHQGTQTLTEGTDAIVRLATLPRDGPTGSFQGREGTTTPW